MSDVMSVRLHLSGVARHLGRDRTTVRAHLSGERVPGQRAADGPDPFEMVEAYVRQRLAEDPHLWATALFDEAKSLDYDQSYVTFARKIRSRGLRPSLCGVWGNQRSGGGDDRSSGRRGMPVGAGWSCRTRRGGVGCSCWWVSCRIRVGSGRG